MRDRVVLCGFVALLALAVGAAAQNPPASQAPPAGQSGAAPSGAVKVGIINIQRAIVESNEGKKAADDLTKRFTPIRNELQKSQDEIAKLQKQLDEGGRVLNDEARANLVREIERKTKDFNRKNDDANSDFQQAESQLINTIGQKVMKVIDEYARKNSYDVILDVSSPQSGVLWATSRVDITDDIVAGYNAASGVPAPASGGGAAAPGAPAASGTPPATAPARPASRPPATKPPPPKPEN